MKNLKRIAGCLILSVLLVSCLILPETTQTDPRTKISKVNLNVDSRFEADIGGDIYVTTNDDTYTVSEVTIVNDDEEWNSNFKPRVSVYLEAYENYYFSDTKKSLFQFSGDNCTFVSAKRRDSGTGLDLVFKVNQIGSSDLAAANLDLTPSAENSSSPGVTSSDPAFVNSGSWVQDAVGWWYRLPNDSYPVSCWQHINGKWYFFNQYGYMTVGWIQWDNKWYYCGSEGSMYINSRTPDGFYVGGDGAWIP